MSLFLVFHCLVIYVTCFYGEDAVEAIVELKEQEVVAICDAVRVYYSATEINTNCDPIESCTKPENFDAKYEFDCIGDDSWNFGSDEYCGCGTDQSFMSLAYPTIRYGPDGDRNDPKIKEFICFTSSLTDIFEENKRVDPQVAWQYIGSPTGAFNMWPGKSDWYDNDKEHPTDTECKFEQPGSGLEDCPGSSYDPRIRPWYIAAASGPKDVVMVLDISGSMGLGTSTGDTRIELLQIAAQDVIDGLGVYDRLYIVFFNVMTKTCDSYFGGSSEMQFTNEDNRELFKECVGDVAELVRGDTNFEIGFNKAFEVLDQRISSSVTCHTVILFLTDGEITDGADGNTFLKQVEEANNADVAARIFTFSLSEDATNEIPQKLACQHKGVWTPILDGSDLRSVMTSYYLYFSFSDQQRARGQTWTESYWDFSGLGDMTTVAMGCFSDDGKTLVGVAGVDVILSEFNSTGADFYEDIEPWLFERSNKCFDNKDLDEDLLDSLREHHSCKASIFADNEVGIYVGIGVGVAGGIAFVVIVLVIIIVAVIFFLGGGQRSSPKPKKERKKEVELTEEPKKVVQQPPPQNEMYPQPNAHLPVQPVDPSMIPGAVPGQQFMPMGQQFMPPDGNIQPPNLVPPMFENTPPTVPDFEV